MSGQIFFVAAIPARVLCTDVLRRLQIRRVHLRKAKSPALLVSYRSLANAPSLTWPQWCAIDAAGYEIYLTLLTEIAAAADYR